MTISTIAGFSATAGSNTDINGVDIGEGTAPSNINNALRALGALLKNMDTGASTLTSPVMTNATIGGLTYPSSDGTANQFLKTNGSGTLSFDTVTLTTINNNADNRIITGSGTADTLEAEANLTYNGSTLAVTGAITASTTITASGNITAFSDVRLKSDVATIDNALDKVMNLRGVTYTKSAEKGMGVIAQEVEKVIPEVVSDGEYKSVAYGNMVGLLIEAVKELKTQLDNHRQGCKCNDTTAN
tara:strand:+ start:490 stop:1221 length:732 start_codon:yes stop_codon:yes gene_type:complete